MIDAENVAAAKDSAHLEIGVRPEFISIGGSGIEADIVKVSDAGRYRIVETQASGSTIKLLVAEGESIPTGKIHLSFDPSHTQIYEDGWIAGGRA